MIVLSLKGRDLENWGQILERTMSFILFCVSSHMCVMSFDSFLCVTFLSPHFPTSKFVLFPILRLVGPVSFVVFRPFVADVFFSEWT